MRQALVARVVNLVSREAWAGTANLIYHHGSISGCSGILFKKRYSGTRGPEAMPKEKHRISRTLLSAILCCGIREIT
jgi:hypothetical protein